MQNMHNLEIFMDNKLNPRAFRFVEEYIRLNSVNEAARAAGMHYQTAARLLEDPRVQHAIELRRQQIAEAVNVDAVWVLQQWVDLARADPSKVVSFRRLCCRYCYGMDHQHQWTAREYAEACARAMDKDEMPPGVAGGVNFNHTLDPVPDCPECRGEGVEELFVEDTRFLTGPERLLVAGVKQTKNGIEVVFRDQDQALAKIADYLGMIVKRGELSGPNGRPLMPGGGSVPMVEEVLPREQLMQELQARGLPLTLLERLE